MKPVPTHPGIDQRVLRQDQYASAANLDARVSIYQYATSPLDVHDRAIALVPGGVRGRRVLDAGCGPGSYFGPLGAAGAEIIGFDLSVGMLRESRRRPDQARGLVNGDLQRLPFVTGSFDVVLSMHMLYHLPERWLGITEMARVLRPSGVAMVVTNAVDHQRQTDEVVYASYADVVGVAFDRTKTSGMFPLERAPDELSPSFEVLGTEHFEGTLRVPEVDPVVAYIASMRSWIGIDDEQAWTRFLARCSHRIREAMEADGAFTITAHSGVVIGRRR